MGRPRSAAMRACSISSRASAVSLGGQVTVRLSSCTSLVWVLASPALNLAKSPMERMRNYGCKKLFGGQCFAFGNAGLEFFHVFVRQFHGADEGTDLAVTVTVAAAGDEQMIFVRDLKITLGHGGGMLGVKTFDAVESGIHEAGNDVVGAVQTGMGHDGEAAGLMDQFHAFRGGHLGLGHPGGAAFFEVALERLVEGG